jgi:hypothetical protein
MRTQLRRGHFLLPSGQGPDARVQTGVGDLFEEGRGLMGLRHAVATH